MDFRDFQQVAEVDHPPRVLLIIRRSRSSAGRRTAVVGHAGRITRVTRVFADLINRPVYRNIAYLVRDH